MSDQNRREFLRNSAAVTGAAALYGGGAHAADDPVEMCVAKWKTPSEIGDPTDEMGPALTEQALAGIGGLQRFVKKGQTVWVKPNIAWDRTPEQAANTNPDVVKTLVRLCLEAGAKKVYVGDNPCHPARKSYPSSGIEEAAKEAGAEVVYLDRNRFVETDIGGKALKTIPLFPGILECDLVISAPVVKHHSSAEITVGMKNYMGVADNRRKFHQDLPTSIRDIAVYMKPRVTVVDAIRIMVRNGPTGGDLDDVKRTNIVYASTDIVAADAFGAELLGRNPQEIGSIVQGQEAGLGTMDYKSIPYKEIEVG